MSEIRRIKNKMGIMPVNRLLVTMALPMMLSMLIQALYNIVDSFFVAQISENAFAAVSLAFPVQLVIIGINTGTGVGINALLSKRLGEKNFEDANKVAANAIFLAFSGYLCLLIFGIFAVRFYFETQTDNQAIVQLGVDYLSVMTMFSFGVFFLITFEKLLQATGRTVHSMACQLLGALMNIALDPIMIFGKLGFPKLGVKGAAIATVAAQITAASLALFINLKFNNDIKLKLKNLKPNGKIIKRIYMVGAPSILMDFTMSSMVYLLNHILIGFSETATNVLGAYYKLQSFIYMPVFGLNNGLVPIIGYNYGAQNKERIIKAIKLAVTYATSIMALGLIALMLFAGNLLLIFNASGYMLEIGVKALRTISLGYVMAGFNIVALSVCQAFGYGVLSMSASFVRQILVLLPVAWALASSFGLIAVWWAFPIAEGTTFILCIIFLKLIYTKKIGTIKAGE
ncbi:MAG: MATE family efflux transporter [Eubacterium sp.]|jgi:putative MATE family efflux protein|nr:MATE family efflux transporter [Eubacterium sp.]